MEILDSVLLVDDDEAANFFHKCLIESLGLSKDIYQVQNGKDAFDYIENRYRSLSQLPSLVLVDIAMPGMNGIELIKELQTSDLLSVNKIPLAVVTSSDSERDRQAISSLGNFSYHTKPLNEIKFFNILETAVAPYLYSTEKRRYVNEMHKILSERELFLQQQHAELKIKLEEIKKYRKEVTERIKKFRL